MGKIWLIKMRILCCVIIFVLPIDMLIMGRKKSWEDFKLLWNNDGEFHTEEQNEDNEIKIRE